MPDFCVEPNFCTRLQRCGHGRLGSEGKHIGFLEKTGPCKHLIYFGPPQAVNGPTKLTSLRGLISDLAKRARHDGFPQHEIFKLARQLAAAVLQFYATTLLKAQWCSDDIVFLGESSKLILSAALERPHFRLQLLRQNHQRQILASETSQTTRSIYRNPHLFSLAVTMVELAYEAPLSSLRSDADLVDGVVTKDTDFFTAQRLSQVMSRTFLRTVGKNYARVVRKCIA